MTKIAGKVSIFSPGKENVPGIKLIGVGWKNAEKHSRLLHKQLEGEYVELTLNDEDCITEVNVIPSTNYSGKSNANQVVDDFFKVYGMVKSRLVPKNVEPRESYAVRELEVQALKVAVELYKQTKVN